MRWVAPLLGFVGATGLAVGLLEATAFHPHPVTGEETVVSVEHVASMGSRLDVHLTMSVGNQGERLELAAFPTHSGAQRRVWIVDGTVSSPTTHFQGLQRELATQLALIAPGVSVQTAASAQTTALFTNLDQAASDLVVVVGGALPADVFSRQRDLLTPWLKAGGQLISAGAPIGYYSSAASGAGVSDAGASLHQVGTWLVLGTDEIDTTERAGRRATTPSAFASALRLRYRQTEIGVPTRLPTGVRSRVLGWTGDGFSSVTAFGVGDGSLVLFAGPASPDNYFADDTARIIASGVLDADGRLAQQTVSVTAGETAQFDWSIPNASGWSRATLVVVDASRSGNFFVAKRL